MGLRRRGVIGLVVVVVAWLGATGSAAAHGGGATFDVQEVVGSVPGQVSLRVGIAHEADGHPAEGAIVEVVAVAPDGSRSATSTAERQVELGTYATILQVPRPGDWEVVVTSSFPPGTISVPVTVAASDGQDDGGGALVSTAVPDEDDGGSVTTNLVIAAVSGVVGGSLGLWASKRRSARKRVAAVDDEDGHAPG